MHTKAEATLSEPMSDPTSGAWKFMRAQAMVAFFVPYARPLGFFVGTETRFKVDNGGDWILTWTSKDGLANHVDFLRSADVLDQPLPALDGSGIIKPGFRSEFLSFSIF